MALVNAVAYESPLLESLSVSPAAAEVMVIGGCVSGIDNFAVSVMFFNMFGHCCPIHWRNFPKCLWWTRIGPYLSYLQFSLSRCLPVLYFGW
jgi:hypothetical protein